VDFANLGLVIVDEQHRFGVQQRFQLMRKPGEGEPDVLVMTATPIPRTLALTVYGDLEVSVIDELPPGRSPCRDAARERRARR
jgi:ATP-dependent DNA helicase RecG